MIELSFHGAAGTVTGSKYLLEVNGRKVLIDCGMFQGPGRLRQLNWDAPWFEPTELEAVIVTHGHIDHIGYLPKLVRRGYTGKVYATAPTVDISGISLLDAAHIQEEDAEFRNRKHLTHHKKALPLYTTDNAEAAIELFTAVPYDKWVDVCEGVRFRLRIVGHILGAASVEVEVSDGGTKKTILFSGDVGRYGNPLTIDPAEPPECDYLVCESTYGGRLHFDEDPRQVFSELIHESIRHKSVLLIPAFAVSRTQQITFLINGLIRDGLIPEIDIYIDSPMAISATDIFCKYHAYHSIDIKQLDGSGCILEGKNVHLCRKRKDSKDLNKLKGPAVIMSSSGMMTGGRIMHHLMLRLPDPATTVLLSGFMAEGTPGRKLAEGATELRIHKQMVPVKARVRALYGISGHADYSELLKWLEPIKTPPQRVFVTHGEPPQSTAMAEHLRQNRGWNCHLPELHETVRL